MLQCSRRMLGALMLGSCLAALPGAVALAQQPRPNILFILADNLGYGDLGVYGGGELRGATTPPICERAAQGLRQTQVLGGPRSTPILADLVTEGYFIDCVLSLGAVESSGS